MTVGSWKKISPKLSTGTKNHGEYQYFDPVHNIRISIFEHKLENLSDLYEGKVLIDI